MVIGYVLTSAGFCLIMTAIIWGVAKSSKDKRTIKHLPFSISPILRYPFVALILLVGVCLFLFGLWLLDV